ncbi:alpha/beta hydrolase [Longibacter sp.]|jgi:alpha-beta hydrolase superfamily lysophospholipase|uniref:alpha/beta hydrolase n=1 Tax=Longibacter sp. TaxID=2045415 RepID=UPI003EC14694
MPVPARIPPDNLQSLMTVDGLHLVTRHWACPTPRGTVLLVHGYGEHSGRYGHVARAMNEHHVEVYAYDQRGYGRSEGPRAFVRSFDAYVDDLDLAISHVRRRIGDRPLYLFGHSMGGAVVLLFALERQIRDVAGLLLSSPAIEVDPDIAPFLRKIARFVGAVLPRLPVVTSPEGRISRDQDVVDEAEQDPLNYHGRIQARTGAEILRANQRIQKQLRTLLLPFLVFHGTADVVTSPEASRRLYDQAASDDKTLHLYDGLYHETFNEPERDDVIADICTWLDHRLPKAAEQVK